MIERGGNYPSNWQNRSNPQNRTIEPYTRFFLVSNNVLIFAATSLVLFSCPPSIDFRLASRRLLLYSTHELGSSTDWGTRKGTSTYLGDQVLSGLHHLIGGALLLGFLLRVVMSPDLDAFAWLTRRHRRRSCAGSIKSQSLELEQCDPF